MAALLLAFPPHIKRLSVRLRVMGSFLNNGNSNSAPRPHLRGPWLGQFAPQRRLGRSIKRSGRKFALAGDAGPELMRHSRPSEIARAQGKPGARLHPQPRMQNKNKHTSIVTTGSPEIPGLPCAMVLTVSFVLSPVTGLFCHRRSRGLLREN